MSRACSTPCAAWGTCVPRAMSLRWRIALGLALIAALVCALGATGAYLTTKHQLESSIDDSLLGAGPAANASGRLAALSGDRRRQSPADPQRARRRARSSPRRRRRSSTPTARSRSASKAARPCR